MHGPELGIDLRDTYAGVGGQVGWQPITASRLAPADGLAHGADVRRYELYSDDFSAGSLGPHWKVANDDWRVMDGVLAGGEQSFLAVDRRRQAPVRIEYDARSSHPRDLSAFFEPLPINLSRGHLIAFAGQYSGRRIELDAKNQVKVNNELTRGVPGQ